MEKQEKELLRRLNDVRRKLGNDYHLGVDLTEHKIKWSLFVHYKNPVFYFSPENTSILNSDNNTIEELEDFTVKHRRYDLYRVYRKITQIMIIIATILCGVNIFFAHNIHLKTILNVIIITIDSCAMIPGIILMALDSHNQEVEIREIVEFIDRMKDTEESADDGSK